MSDLHHFTAIELRDSFIRGEYTAVQIAEFFLKRIEKHNQQLGAFLSILGPRMLLKAEQLDHKRSQNKPLGKLAGIPIAIKDNMHIAGEITSCASKFLRNYKAPFDATAIRLMEQEDALFTGKTNLDEFAMGSSNENSAFFPSHNPWDLTCSPGGSSGGSAAAVAARLSLIATGSDTGGSIRQPAGFCGIVGFKPTYGRVSRYGLVAYGSSLDQIGPFATSVADIALTMETIGRHCPHDSTSLDLPPESYPLPTNLHEIRIGVPTKFLENLKPDAKANFDHSLNVMRSLGAKITEIDLDILKYSIAVYYIVATAEASTNLARFDGIRYGVRSKEAKNLEEIYEFSRQDGFGKEVKKRIMLGTYVLSAGFQDAFYKKAQKVRTLIIEAFEKAFADCDAVAMPIAPSAAFPLKAFNDPIEMYLQDIFSIPANLAGLPAISVPSGFDSNKMPLGLQLIGPQMCDVPVIQYAHAFEHATQFSRKIPPLFNGNPP
ncbi:MAG: Asp-tRNA(Asn)/Glu-tRNA(Gln) amidotransferase subunit GatA [Verrucomicrobia bacterium]|nr:Asp-tRNA(Asn)/Glu-tRNA(Gln) amidotransferase subunit GatA [Verrucomicrobiota bacterium]